MIFQPNAALNLALDQDYEDLGPEKNPLDLITEAQASLQLPAQVIEYALTLALETTLSYYLTGFAPVNKDVSLDRHTRRTLDVEVDIPGASLTIYLTIGEDCTAHDLQEHFEIPDSDIPPQGHLFPLTLSFNDLPDPVKLELNIQFNEIVTIIREDVLFKTWKIETHRAVEGVIDSVHPHLCYVNLPGNEPDTALQGIFHRREWTPKEIPHYKQGKCFVFFVQKVLRNKGLIQVHLSRKSINLPAAILRQKLPWVKINCVKRVAGCISWIKSSLFVPKEILRELRTELMNESVYIINPDTPTILTKKRR